MALLGRRGVQDYLTLAFPIKSAAHAEKLARKLVPLMPQMSTGPVPSFAVAFAYSPQKSSSSNGEGSLKASVVCQ